MSRGLVLAGWRSLWVVGGAGFGANFSQDASETGNRLAAKGSDLESDLSYYCF